MISTKHYAWVSEPLPGFDLEPQPLRQLTTEEVAHDVGKYPYAQSIIAPVATLSMVATIAARFATWRRNHGIR